MTRPSGREGAMSQSEGRRPMLRAVGLYWPAPHLSFPPVLTPPGRRGHAHGTIVVPWRAIRHDPAQRFPTASLSYLVPDG